MRKLTGMPNKSALDTRRHSRLVVDGVKQAPNRSMLRAVGFGDADFEKPQVGVASTWSNLTPCNVHIDELARLVAAGADGAGAKAVTFGTITVSDGISMGTPGMRYSLVSREVIADSIETVVGAQGFDGVVAIGGCDKNMPGCMMALARLNRQIPRARMIVPVGGSAPGWRLPVLDHVYPSNDRFRRRDRSFEG